MENLYDKRKSYEKLELVEGQIANHPMQQFKIWYEAAESTAGEWEANAMSISTIDEDGTPRTRMVLLKSFSKEGFVFYTNYLSKKGRAIEKNPVACVHFFWPYLERQVVIKVRLEKVASEESDEYFNSRPEGSRLGAIASPQSQVISDRKFLEDKMIEVENFHHDKMIKRPEHWGGYLARPYEVEFWQGRKNRLHDRIVYTAIENSDWRIERLAP